MPMKKRLAHLTVFLLLLGSLVSYAYLNVARHQVLSDMEVPAIEAESFELEPQGFNVPEVHIIAKVIEVVRRTVQLQ